MVYFTCDLSLSLFAKFDRAGSTISTSHSVPFYTKQFVYSSNNSKTIIISIIIFFYITLLFDKIILYNSELFASILRIIFDWLYSLLYKWGELIQPNQGQKQILSHKCASMSYLYLWMKSGDQYFAWKVSAEIWIEDDKMWN